MNPMTRTELIKYLQSLGHDVADGNNIIDSDVIDYFAGVEGFTYNEETDLWEF